MHWVYLYLHFNRKIHLMNMKRGCHIHFNLEIILISEVWQFFFKKKAALKLSINHSIILAVIFISYNSKCITYFSWFFAINSEDFIYKKNYGHRVPNNKLLAIRLELYCKHTLQYHNKCFTILKSFYTN